MKSRKKLTTKHKDKTLGEFYKDSWLFIKQTKKEIYIVCSVFLIFALLGFFVSMPEDTKQQLLDMLKQLMFQFQGKSLLETIWLIFSNNIRVSFFALVSGLLFGIIPIILAASNGTLIGFVANMAVAKEGILVLWKIFPHGIFELPAVIISMAVGLRLGKSVLGFRQKKETTWGLFKESMLVFILVVFVLLFIAAIIEGFLVFFLK